jgi:hypothetical protein
MIIAAQSWAGRRRSATCYSTFANLRLVAGIRKVNMA